MHPPSTAVDPKTAPTSITGSIPITTGTTPVAITLDPERPLQSLTGLLRPYRKRLIAAIGFFILKDSPQWLLPVLTGAIIDIVVDHGPASRLIWLGVAAAVLLLMNYPTHVRFVRLFFGTSRELGATLRNALTERLQLLSIGFHNRSNAAVIQTKVVRDVENIELMFQQAGPPALSAVFVLLGALTMTALNVPAFLAVYAVTVPLAAALTLLWRRRSERRNAEFRREVERFSSRVGEMADLIPITRAHGLEQLATARVTSGAAAVRDAGLTLDMVNHRFGSATWISFQILGVGCLIVAASASLFGWLDITSGQVVMLGSYFTILTGAVTSFASLIPLVTRAAESVRSIAEVLVDPDVEANSGKAELDTVDGAITLDAVAFRYPRGEHDAVADITLDIAAGETVAFVGASGSGKSTLVNLVLGFIRPTSGTIRLDGVDLATLDLRSVRRRFVAVVPQETVLFEASVRDNVTFGLGDVDDERVLAALAAANALDIVAGLPHGIDTIVGGDGVRLSGGQRQRLAVARALIRDPRILLLDEATSALDAESEAAVRQAMHTLMAGRTTLIVAHRLSSVRMADRIVVLDAGRIVEIGSHEQLLTANGRYADLHRLQTA